MKLYEVRYEWRDANDNVVDRFDAVVAASTHKQAGEKGLTAARKKMGRKRVNAIHVTLLDKAFVQ